MLSYYLNSKIKELQNELEDHYEHGIKINGKIYDRCAHIFKNIYADLICIEKYQLN